MSKQPVSVLDYGAGNLQSMMNALEYVGCLPKLVSRRSEILNSERLIVPGVGAMGMAMERLRNEGLDEAVIERASQGVPILGVCLGMQLLCSKSYEFGEHSGLDLIPGEVKPFSKKVSLKVPHIGWNTLFFKGDHPIFANLEPDPDVYFLHSFYVEPVDKNHEISASEYDIGFTSSIAKDNVVGLQFHPEKSQAVGLQMLKNFVEFE